MYMQKKPISSDFTSLTVKWHLSVSKFLLLPDNRTYSAFEPGRVAQPVACLATDASLTADPGVASLIPARSHTFVEIDHEIISMVILLPSAESFKNLEGLLSVTSESMCTKYWLTACSSLPRSKCG